MRLLLLTGLGRARFPRKWRARPQSASAVRRDANPCRCSLTFEPSTAIFSAMGRKWTLVGQRQLWLESGRWADGLAACHYLVTRVGDLFDFGDADGSLKFPFVNQVPQRLLIRCAENTIAFVLRQITLHPFDFGNHAMQCGTAAANRLVSLKGA